MEKLILITLGSIIIIVISIYMKSKNEKQENSGNLPKNSSLSRNKETKVSISKAKELIASDKNLLILDTRSKMEYNSGHIEGAMLIPHNKVEMNLNKLKDYKDKPILVYCRTGSRSAIAVNVLIKNGFNKIYHMNQGYSKWK